MAKRNNKVVATSAVQVVAAPATVQGNVAKPQVIVSVKAGIKYRGARAAWYTVLQAHQGKPAADFLAACTSQPPSTPKSGVVEKPSGWLSYFVRTGVATLA